MRGRIFAILSCAHRRPKENFSLRPEEKFDHAGGRGSVGYPFVWWMRGRVLKLSGACGLWPATRRAWLWDCSAQRSISGFFCPSISRPSAQRNHGVSHLSNIIIFFLYSVNTLARMPCRYEYSVRMTLSVGSAFSSTFDHRGRGSFKTAPPLLRGLFLAQTPCTNQRHAPLILLAPVGCHHRCPTSARKI
jgi:hypothetical protein